MSTKKEKEKKLIKNTVWFSSGTFLSKAISFLMVPFYTAILTTEEYSISDLLSTTISLALPFFSLVISNAVCRFTLDKNDEQNRIFSFGLLVELIGFVLLSAISYIVFQCIPSLEPYWVYFIVIYFLTAINTLLSEFIKGLENVKVIALCEVIHTFSFVVSNIVFLRFCNMRIEGYLLSYIVSNVITLLMYLCAGSVIKFITNPFSKSSKMHREMIRYSIPLIPNSAMWWITNSSDRYFVSIMVSVAANGLLSVSYKLPSILSVFISVFHSAWELSVVDDFENEKGKAFFSQIYQKYIQFNALVAAALILASKVLGRFMYSSDFFEAWKFSAILLLGYSFHAIAGFIGYIFTTAKDTKIIFSSTVVGAGLNIVLNFLLISFFGTIGAVWATVISYFATFAVRRIQAKKYIQININEKKAIASFSLITAETIFVWLDFSIGWLISGLIFLAVLVLNIDLINSVFNAAKRTAVSIINKIKGR